MTGERDDVNTTTVDDWKQNLLHYVRGTGLRTFLIWMKQDCLFVKQPTKFSERTVLVENNPRKGLLLHIGQCEG